MPLHQAVDFKKLDIIKAFNNKPKVGIELFKSLCKQNNLDENQISEQLATFFIEERGELNLDYVGDYISGPDKEHSDILKAFVMKQDFTGKSFIEGLRNYLQTFKLPGEAQKIDRLVESFANKYSLDNNKGISGIADSDAAHILAFQSIILNSDLHKKEVKNKMTCEELKKNLRGCNAKENFPDKLLEGLYQEIKDHPFILNFVEVAPGYNLNDKNLTNEPFFKEIDQVLQGKKINGEFINDSIKTSVDKPKKWLSNFCGYEGTISLENSSGACAKIQVYKPSIISRWFLGEKSKIIIQPDFKKEGLVDQNVKFAAELTSNFKTIKLEEKDIKASYNYEKEDLKRAYLVEKNKSSFASIIPDSVRSELVSKVGKTLRPALDVDQVSYNSSASKNTNVLLDKSKNTRSNSI